MNKIYIHSGFLGLLTWDLYRNKFITSLFWVKMYILFFIFLLIDSLIFEKINIKVIYSYAGSMRTIEIILAIIVYFLTYKMLNSAVKALRVLELEIDDSAITDIANNPEWSQAINSKNKKQVSPNTYISTEDKGYYKIVSDEISRGYLDQGLWTKAYAYSDGIESSAKAIYIKMRVEELFNEHANSIENEKNQKRVELRTKENRIKAEKKENESLFLKIVFFGIILSSVIVYYVIEYFNNRVEIKNISSVVSETPVIVDEQSKSNNKEEIKFSYEDKEKSIIDPRLIALQTFIKEGNLSIVSGELNDYENGVLVKSENGSVDKINSEVKGSYPNIIVKIGMPNSDVYFRYYKMSLIDKIWIIKARCEPNQIESEKTLISCNPPSESFLGSTLWNK